MMTTQRSGQMEFLPWQTQCDVASRVCVLVSPRACCPVAPRRPTQSVRNFILCFPFQLISKAATLAGLVCMPLLPCMVCYLRGKAREDNHINGSDKLEGNFLLLLTLSSTLVQIACAHIVCCRAQLNRRSTSTMPHRYKTQILTEKKTTMII